MRAAAGLHQSRDRAAGRPGGERAAVDRERARAEGRTLVPLAATSVPALSVRAAGVGIGGRQRKGSRPLLPTTPLPPMTPE